MTDEPRDRPDDEDDVPAEGPLDVDAEFDRMVADWGPTPTFDEPAPEAAEAAEVADPEPERGSDESLRHLLKQAWPEDPPSRPRPDDEGHFVPPPPPPIPRPEPRRLLAWVAMFGAPMVGLVLLVSGAPLPSYVGYGLFAAFVGGFGYLVATMGRRGDQDGWDDGARL